MISRISPQQIFVVTETNGSNSSSHHVLKLAPRGVPCYKNFSLGGNLVDGGDGMLYGVGHLYYRDHTNNLREKIFARLECTRRPSMVAPHATCHTILTSHTKLAG